MKHDTEIITIRAPVDKLIGPLVLALLQFPEVATLYSCQGEAVDKEKNWDWDKAASYVIFTVGGGSSVECAIFMNFLGERMGSLSTYVKIEMPLVIGVPQVELRVQQAHINSVTEWLMSIRKEWHGLWPELKCWLAKFKAQWRHY
jgi:hypothetical protein